MTEETSSSLVREPSYSGPSRPEESFAIAPEDQHHADAIVAMDPLGDEMSPHNIPEGWTVPPLRLTMLPPAMQGEIRDKLNGVPDTVRTAKEQELTAAAIQSMRGELRLKAGLGGTATPFHVETLQIAREVGELNVEFERIQNDLHEVVGHYTTRDPHTGEAKAAPVYRIDPGSQRYSAMVARQQDILREIRLLRKDDGTYGLNGQKRINEALHSAVMARKELARQAEEEAEVKAMAEQINRDKRIRDAAEKRARLNRNGG